MNLNLKVYVSDILIDEETIDAEDIRTWTHTMIRKYGTWCNIVVTVVVP